MLWFIFVSKGIFRNKTIYILFTCSVLYSLYIHVFYCQILDSNGVGSQVLTTLVTTLPLIFTGSVLYHNSFLASGNFCCLLIAFANSLNPDPYQQDICPDLDSNCLTLGQCWILKEFFEKVNFEQSQQTTTKACKITQHAKR